MAKTEYITIKNASRKVLQRMRQIGIDKAQRLQEIQKRWDEGEYKNSEILFIGLHDRPRPQRRF